MTRHRVRHEAVLKPLYVAMSSLASVKIKVVVVKGSEIFDFVDMTENELSPSGSLNSCHFTSFFLGFKLITLINILRQ